MSASQWSALCVTGLAMFVAGVVWQQFSTPEQWLSEEAARAHVEAAVALHGKTDHTHSGDHTHGHDDSELDQARAEFRAAEERVSAARQRQQWWPRAVQITGVLLAAVGVVGSRSLAA